MSTPAALAVVIPARDEEELLPSCLDSVDLAVQHLRASRPDIACHVFVVLDSCQDGSADVVAGCPGASVVAVEAGCVGVARAAGVEAAAEWASTLGAAPLWVANTDADSTVPQNWLAEQVRLAHEGHDLVVGMVQPTPGDLTVEELRIWRARHRAAQGHHHVHGANLGFSLAAYRSVGGYRPLPVHEDVDLVATMRSAGVSSTAPGEPRVTTSGRRAARAPGGFAGYLADLGA